MNNEFFKIALLLVTNFRNKDITSGEDWVKFMKNYEFYMQKYNNDPELDAIIDFTYHYLRGKKEYGQQNLKFGEGKS